jgi:hypothetical protein
VTVTWPREYFFRRTGSVIRDRGDFSRIFFAKIVENVTFLDVISGREFAYGCPGQRTLIFFRDFSRVRDA